MERHEIFAEMWENWLQKLLGLVVKGGSGGLPGSGNIPMW